MHRDPWITVPTPATGASLHGSSHARRPPIASGRARAALCFALHANPSRRGRRRSPPLAQTVGPSGRASGRSRAAAHRSSRASDAAADRLQGWRVLEASGRWPGSFSGPRFSANLSLAMGFSGRTGSGRTLSCHAAPPPVAWRRPFLRACAQSEQGAFVPSDTVHHQPGRPEGCPPQSGGGPAHPRPGRGVDVQHPPHFGRFLGRHLRGARGRHR